MAAELSARLAPGPSQFRRVAHCGHGVCRNDPDGTLEAIRGWLQQLG